MRLVTSESATAAKSVVANSSTGSLYRRSYRSIVPLYSLGWSVNVLMEEILQVKSKPPVTALSRLRRNSPLKCRDGN